nr:butyrophilin-like protein 1 [Oryctolagus cuniculus]
MEHGCRPSLLCSLPSLLLLAQLPTWGSADDFLVMGPSDPIVAMLDGEATLPCSLDPAMNAEHMELRWFRTKFSEAVLIYQNGREQHEEQMPQYAGRTSLVRDLLTQGQAAVRIQNVRASDNGRYSCFFQKGGHYEEATLELKVAGLGSAPQVHIEGPEQDGVRVVCKASGWFPKPQVQWTDVSGKKFLEFSEAHAQDTAGLFSVEAALVVRDSSAGSVSCSVLNPILGQEKAMAVSIPEPFFPQASPWKAAFAVTLIVLGLLLFGAGFFTRREHSAKVQERQKQQELHQAKEEDQRAEEEALKARDELQADLGWRKAAYLAAWRKAQLYADWREEQFQAWSVTLDPGSAHKNLALTHGKTSVTWKDTCVVSDGRCSVLGLEGITWGRYYWEVDIRNGVDSEFALGVCREHVKRTGFYTESPDKGFWVVGCFNNGYNACTTSNPTSLSLRQHPSRVGIFLDYDGRDVSFYNMTDGSHIFSFPRASFVGTLFPYFMLKSGNVSLSICLVAHESEGLPVPPNNSSFEEPVRHHQEVLSSGSGVDGAPPGAESPLLPCTT